MQSNRMMRCKILQLTYMCSNVMMRVDHQDSFREKLQDQQLPSPIFNVSSLQFSVELP